MTAATATPPRVAGPPAQAAFRRHAAVCRKGADPRHCATCFDLDREASAEAFRRSNGR